MYITIEFTNRASNPMLLVDYSIYGTMKDILGSYLALSTLAVIPVTLSNSIWFTYWYASYQLRQLIWQLSANIVTTLYQQIEV